MPGFVAVMEGFVCDLGLGLIPGAHSEVLFARYSPALHRQHPTNQASSGTRIVVPPDSPLTLHQACRHLDPSCPRSPGTLANHIWKEQVRGAECTREETPPPPPCDATTPAPTPSHQPRSYPSRRTHCVACAPRAPPGQKLTQAMEDEGAGDLEIAEHLPLEPHAGLVRVPGTCSLGRRNCELQTPPAPQPASGPPSLPVRSGPCGD